MEGKLANFNLGGCVSQQGDRLASSDTCLIEASTAPTNNNFPK